jgi:hypothetical protein
MSISGLLRRSVALHRFPLSRLPTYKRYMATTRTYAEAIERLNSLQSNAATLDALRASGGRMSEFAIPEMVEYLGRIGYQVCSCSSKSTLEAQIER